jgi:hypothetical protein
MSILSLSVTPKIVGGEMSRLRRNPYFGGLVAASVVPLILLAYTASAATTKYYISPQGDDGNDGSSVGAGHARQALYAPYQERPKSGGVATKGYCIS